MYRFTIVTKFILELHENIRIDEKKEKVVEKLSLISKLGVEWV